MFNLTDEERTKLRDLMSMDEERHRIWLSDHAEARETRRENIRVSWILTWLQFAEVALLFILLVTWIIKL